MAIESLLAILLILTVALLFSPIGLGGGILFVPILHFLLKWPIEQAMIGSLSLVWMVSLGSMIAHHSVGEDDPEAAKTGILMYVPAAIIGSLIGYFLLENVSEFSIKILVIILMSFILITSIEKTFRKSTKMKNISVEEKTNSAPQSYRVGCGVGGLSAGVLGIGGGAVMVMLSRSYAGLGSHAAAGNSYSVEVVGVPVALAMHLWTSGMVSSIEDIFPLFQIIVLLSLVAITAWFGARTAIKHIPEKAVNFAFLLIVGSGLLSYLHDFVTTLL